MHLVDHAVRAGVQAIKNLKMPHIICHVCSLVDTVICLFRGYMFAFVSVAVVCQMHM